MNKLIVLVFLCGCAPMSEQRQFDKEYDAHETAMAQSECINRGGNIYEHANARGTWECISDREFESKLSDLEWGFDE